MTIKEVKAKIFETECGERIKEGMFCSEPIQTIGKKGLIDNYFIYGRDSKRQHFTKPKICFGIYTDLNEVAYLDKNSELEDKNYSSSEEVNIEKCFEAYDRYAELFPQIRMMAYKDCDNENIILLSEYIKCFRKFSGDVLFMFYNTLYPTFFEWVNKQIGNMENRNNF